MRQRFWGEKNGTLGKSSMNQIKKKKSMKSITNRLGWEDERLSGTEDKVEKLVHAYSNKNKQSNHEFNIQDLQHG